MKKLLLLCATSVFLMGTADPSPRTHAWRLVDTVSGNYRCDLACNPNATDAARDTACFQAMLNKASATSNNVWNSAEVPAGECLISTKLTVTGATGFALFGQGHDKTILRWMGAGADDVLYFDDVAYSSVKDLTIKPGYAKTINSGVRITNGAGAGGPSTCLFENIFMDAASGKLVNGFYVDNTGGGGDNNNEFHTFRNNAVFEYSGAAYKINGGQAKSQAFYDNTCLGSSRWTLDHSVVNTSTGVFPLDGLASTYLSLNDGVVVYPRVQETFYGVLVDASTDTLTIGTNGFSVGDALALATLTGDTNLTTGTIYWVQAIPSAGVIKLAATSGGSAINITGTSGTAAIQAATLPGGMVDGTTYYVRSISGSNITLSATSGVQPQALFVPTSKGTGTFRIKPVAEKTRCVDNVAGSFRWYGGGGGYNSDYDFHIDSLGEASKIDGFNSEFSRKFLYKAGSYDVGGSSEIIPMSVSNVRWDSSGVNMAATGRAREVVATGHSGTLQISSSGFGGHGAGEVRPIAFDLQRTNAFSIVLTSNDIATPLSLVSEIFPYGIPKLFGNLRWRNAEQSAVSLTDTRGAIDVLDYGVVLDGLLGDDAAAMQHALDAVPAGGVLDLPCGTIRVDTGLTVTTPFDSITVKGCGPSTVTRDVFGGSGWNTPIDGTTLATYMSSGTLLTIGSASQGGKYTIRDIALQAIGSSSKTTVGLSLVGSAGAAIADLHHVTIANFAVGLDCRTCEDGQFSSLQPLGNDVGILADASSNSNVFTALDCGANNECGVIKGGLNSFVGGTVQGSVRYGFRVQGGENRFSDIYFEDAATVGAAVSLEKVASWRLTDISTGSGTLTFKGDALPALNTQVYIWCDGSGCAVPTGFAAGTKYYVSAPSGATFKLAATSGGTAIIPSSTGSGILRVTTFAPEGGLSNKVDHIHAGTNDDISVWTGQNQLDLGNFHQDVLLRPGTDGNIVTGWPTNCTDQGTTNLCIDLSSGYPTYNFSALSGSTPGLLLAGAAYLRMQMATAGGVALRLETSDALGYSRLINSANSQEYLSFQPNGGDARTLATRKFLMTGGLYLDDLYAWNGGSAGGTVTMHDITDFSASLKTNTINEHTANAGVTVDQCLVKDGSIYATNVYPPVATGGGAYINLGGSSDQIEIGASGGTTFVDDVFVNGDLGGVTNIYPSGDITGSSSTFTGLLLTGIHGVKVPAVTEYTPGDGVAIDTSGGPTTTTTIKDGYINAIGYTSIDGTCGLSVTNDTTDAMTLQAGVFTANVTTFDVNGDLTPDKITVGTSGGGNVRRTLYAGGNLDCASVGSLDAVVTKTIPAGTLGTDGDCVKIANDYELLTGTVDFYAYLGANTIHSQAAQVAVGSYQMQATICRTGATTGRFVWHLDYPGGGHYYPTQSAFNLAWANAQDFVIKLKCSAATTDGHLWHSDVEYIPAVN